MNEANNTSPDETRWVVSYAADRMRPGDSELEPVRADAIVEANRMIATLRAGSCVRDGAVVISVWSLHRLAHHLVGLVERGFEGIDGCGDGKNGEVAK